MTSKMWISPWKLYDVSNPNSQNAIRITASVYNISGLLLIFCEKASLSDLRCFFCQLHYIDNHIISFQFILNPSCCLIRHINDTEFFGFMSFISCLKQYDYFLAKLRQNVSSCHQETLITRRAEFHGLSPWGFHSRNFYFILV